MSITGFRTASPATLEVALRRNYARRQRVTHEFWSHEEQIGADNPERYAAMREHHRELDRQFHAQHPQRTPGWMCPGPANRWRLYPDEAHTFDTPYGPVTVGRNLARMYDLTGWPEEDDFKAMVEVQARWNQ